MIYRARKRYKLLGQAAVTVSVVHVHKGALAGPYHLDGRPVDILTPKFLVKGHKRAALHGKGEILR